MSLNSLVHSSISSKITFDYGLNVPWAHSITVDASLGIVHSIIEKLIHNIDGITSSVYNPYCLQWNIQYGTKPLIDTLDRFEKQVYYKKVLVLNELIDSFRYTDIMNVSPFHFIKLGITNKQRLQFDNMLTRFRHSASFNYECDPIEFDYLRGWSSTMIRYCCSKEGGVTVSLHRTSGCSASHWHIKKLVISALQPNNVLFERRKNYLALFEGIGQVEEKDISTSEIYKYRCIFDDLRCREICEYL
jgi:hypothetical protein